MTQTTDDTKDVRRLRCRVPRLAHRDPEPPEAMELPDTKARREQDASERPSRDRRALPHDRAGAR
jgi:hypothetical protein